jgi:hypothetical protein
MSTFIMEAKPSSETSAIREGVQPGSAINPMQRETREPLSLRLVPRCYAKTRSGKPCQSPRVKGKACCRMHGGAKGSGAPRGRDNGRYQHGLFTCEAIERRRKTRAMIAELQAFAQDILQR